MGRLKLRFGAAAVVRSTVSSAVESTAFLWRLLYFNADLFAIILLYIVGVMETDILHSVAILLFIVYAISHTARQSPAVLVVYSSIVIILLFIFQFDPLSSDVSRPVFQKAGFIGFGSGYESAAGTATPRAVDCTRPIPIADLCYCAMLCALVGSYGLSWVF